MRRVSKKQAEYQAWLEREARPTIIERDGNSCVCCGRSAYIDEKLDIDHILTKGSRPDLKRDINNMELRCRFPCHRNKTDHIPCLHSVGI